MRKIILSAFLFLLVCNGASAQLSDKQIEQVKIDLVRAVESGKITDSLYDRLNGLKLKTPLIVAYVGALQALKAKHAWNPYNKVTNVSRSLKTLAKAVKMDKNNLEIRFIRFSIEYNTPAFLGFGKNLEGDRKEILKHYQNENFKSASDKLIKNIAVFMIESKRCTADEVNILKKFI
ncbi:hypothetical protein ABIB40_002407 [Pedobacter sp. UYP30]|uniref:hypothetical protein n=1 Tax=Pedobacter sp. UYP30 TaxID=1756400 RepID=UPI0033952306